LGNVIDPIDVIEGITLDELQGRLEKGNLDPKEVKVAKAGQKADFPHGIPQCGTDALRFALCSYVAEGRDINMNINRVEGYRRFCNKLWNATRFALMKLGDDYLPESEICLFGKESMVDKWILSRLNAAIVETNKAFEANNLMNATQAIYSFWLYELCDVYIEAIKPILTPDNPDVDSRRCTSNVLYICLEQGLRLLHPFMPYVTEELYQRLVRRPQDVIPSISLSTYPLVREEFSHPQAEAAFAKLYEVVKTVRRLASEQNVPKNTTVRLSTENKDSFDLLQAQEVALNSLVRSIGTLELGDSVIEDSQPIECQVFLKFTSK
jgi:valyl-tRNA synthetase